MTSAGAGQVWMLVLGAAVVSAAPLVAQRRPLPPPSVDLVEIDVVVTDRRDRAVGDLAAADFRIKEDGQPVEIKTFSKMAIGIDDPREGRTISLLLDDTGIPALGTISVQSIAGAFLAPAERGDELSVVRLHSRSDEAYGDLPEALQRIKSYRGGAVTFVRRESQAAVLRQIAVMSRQLATNGNRRKAIVCIGAQAVCDVPEVEGVRDASDAWTAAVAAAAKANVAVYAVVPGRPRFRGGGIVEATGGETHGTAVDVRQSIASVWRDSTTHYLLGYWPGPNPRRRHSIEVSVERPRVKVRARRQRGEGPS